MFYDQIPDEDKVCINCGNFSRANEGGDKKLCCGTMPCLNYHKDNTENFFVPDDYYLQSRFGCSACSHKSNLDEPYEGCECLNCSRYYSDHWERSAS